MNNNVLHKIFEELLIFADPIRGAAVNDEALKAFFKPMGWNFDNNSGMPLANVVNSIGAVIQIAETLGEIIEEEEVESLGQIIEILSAVKNLYENIENLVNAFDEAELVVNQVKEVMEDIIHHLTVTYLQRRLPIPLEILRWIEVVEIKSGTETEYNSSNKIVRFPYEFEVLNFDNLSTFLQNPADAINQIYFAPFDRTTATGAQQFTDKLFPRIGRLAQSLGASYVYGVKPEYNIDFGSVGNDLMKGALTTTWNNLGENLTLGGTLMYSPQELGNLGWIIVPFGEIHLDAILGKYYFEIKTALQVGGIIISDDGDVDFESDGGLTKVSVDLLARKLPEDDTGLAYLIGEREGTRLELGQVSLGGSFVATTSSLDFDVHFNVEQAKFVISAGGQDSFIAKLLPENGIEIPFDFLIGYSTEKSLYFGANAGIELALPLHLDFLGVLRADELYLKIKTQEYGLKTEASLTGGASLGPLSVSFEQIGLQAKFDWTKAEKNMGFADFSLEFKPPNGLGLAINAGAVIGGGYLFFDFDKEEYAGALELTIAGLISAKAIGLITTKMPDGSKGFSMLIIISAEFLPPFQLGYGFTLIGIGGLLGLNRTVLLDPLRDGVRTGAVNSIMFPQNVVENAPRIISDLKTVFPAYEGRFLIGPMAKLGWGTPTLISLSFGLIIEIPGNIAILGLLSVILPDKVVPLVKIQVAFVGTLDFDKKVLTFDASLYESSVLTMTLEGDMAVRLKWGDNPDFLITVGGFHPSFTPPPLALPSLKRLAINILNNSVGRIRVECYQAVTSNTVQFGAKAEVYFDLRAVEIEGYIAFDALFQFSPFYFIISLGAGFSLKVAGFDLLSVRVRMELSGPTPWRAKGTGSISVLFFEISADFDKTWGEEKVTSLPETEVLPKFLEEINNKEQWSTALTNSKNLLVSLRKLEEGVENLLVLHPSGTLTIQQKFVPLKVNIEKIGNQKSSDVKQLVIESAESNGSPLQLKEVKEDFARAQYQELSDAEKLSKPSFEKMQGGVEVTLGDKSIENGSMVRKLVEYELTIIDKQKLKPFQFGIFFGVIGLLFKNLLRGNSTAKSAVSKASKQLREPFSEKLDIQDVLFSVTFQNTNALLNSGATFKSEMEAESFMQNEIAKNPTLKKQIHIVPNHELEEV